MQYDDRANRKQIDASVNEEFEVSLPEARTAGYRWALKKIGEPNLRLQEDTIKLWGGFRLERSSTYNKKILRY